MHIAETMVEALLSDWDDQLLIWEARWDHRKDKRMAGYLSVLRSDDYVYVRCAVPTSPSLVGPDPTGRTLSKRGWEWVMQEWRKALKAERRLCAVSSDTS